MSPFSVIRYLLHFPTGVCVLGQANLFCRDVPTKNTGQMSMFKITICFVIYSPFCARETWHKSFFIIKKVCVF